MAPETSIPLDRNERVLWTGAPPRGLLLRGIDLFMIPFSVVWAGGALAAAGATVVNGHVRSERPFIALPLLIFVPVALYITVGRFIVDIMVRSHTAYAVTTDRIVIQSGVFRPTIKSINLRTLTDLSLSERADGSGSITFGPVNPWGAWSSGLRWPGVPLAPMFERIPSARTVYGIIRDAQRTSSMAPAS